MANVEAAVNTAEAGAAANDARAEAAADHLATQQEEEDLFAEIASVSLEELPLEEADGNGQDGQQWVDGVADEQQQIFATRLQQEQQARQSQVDTEQAVIAQAGAQAEAVKIAQAEAAEIAQAEAERLDSHPALSPGQNDTIEKPLSYADVLAETTPEEAAKKARAEENIRKGATSVTTKENGKPEIEAKRQQEEPAQPKREEEEQSQKQESAQGQPQKRDSDQAPVLKSQEHTSREPDHSEQE